MLNPVDIEMSNVMDVLKNYKPGSEEPNDEISKELEQQIIEAEGEDYNDYEYIETPSEPEKVPQSNPNALS